MSNRGSDAALIQRSRLGSKEAFGELVLRYHRPVLAVAYRMTGNTTVAEDVAQVAFLRVWMELDSLRDAAAFKSWLYRLAVNASIDHLQRNPRTLGLPEGQADGTRSPEAEALRRESALAVQQAVLALPAQCRAALILREYEGLSYKEIARALDIPIGTVMSRLHCARSLLRAALGEEQAQAERPVER